MGKNQSKSKSKKYNKEIKINTNDLLEKIQSIYIIENILKFIKDENFKYKIILYSKKNQKKLNTLKFDYDSNHVLKNKINLLKYIVFDISDLSEYKKLMQDFKNEMNNINIEPDFLIKFINDFPMGCLYKDSGEKQSKTIKILSPLFDIFSKTDLFEIYETLFNMDLVRNNKLKKNISAIIDKLNQLNKYPPIKLYIGDCKDIDYLKKIKTNLSSIKSLNLSFSNNLINEETISFFDLFFTTVEFQNNLIKLNLSRGQITYPDAKILEQINNFKVLEELSIKSIIFDNYNSDNVIILKLKNLKKLYLNDCNEYINFENCCSNLIVLDLFISGMQKPLVPLKMPNLENLNMIHFI